MQGYVTVAQIGCPAAAAFAKRLVWSRDCSAQGYLWHGVKCSAGLAGHRAVSVRVPVCPWQPLAWAARLEGCPGKAVWSEAAAILQQGLGSVLFLLLFTKALLVTAVEHFSLPLLPFPSAPSLPPVLASDKILSVPSGDCLLLSYLPFLVEHSHPFCLLPNTSSLTTLWYVLSLYLRECPWGAAAAAKQLLTYFSLPVETASPESNLEFPNENAVYF